VYACGGNSRVRYLHAVFTSSIRSISKKGLPGDGKPHQFHPGKACRAAPGALLQPIPGIVKLQAIPLVELINTATGVNEFLLSCVERMAFGADFYRDILPR
jgi:hypothetical protein